MQKKTRRSLSQGRRNKREVATESDQKDSFFLQEPRAQLNSQRFANVRRKVHFARDEKNWTEAVQQAGAKKIREVSVRPCGFGFVRLEDERRDFERPTEKCNRRLCKKRDCKKDLGIFASETK